MQAASFTADPPLELEHGYAAEELAKRGMPPPLCGAFEVVNKNKEGEMIAIVVAHNAAELCVKPGERVPLLYMRQGPCGAAPEGER